MDLSSQPPGCSRRPLPTPSCSKGGSQGRAGRNRQWSRMSSQPHPGKHIISYLFHVDFKGAKRLTLWTGTGFHLLVLRLEKGSQDEVALAAVVFDHAELRQDPCATCHHSTGPDQLIQVQLPEERQIHWMPAGHRRQNTLQKYSCCKAQVYLGDAESSSLV